MDHPKMLVTLLGIQPVLTSSGKAAPVANEDMARVAAAVLMAPDRHAGKTYRPTGPELLSGEDTVKIVERAVGHRVLPMKLPFWMFRKVAQQQRVDPLEVSCFRYYVEDNKNGAFSFEGGVTSVVEELTDALAENFGTTARRYAALPFARQTLGNRLKAFANFNLTLLYPGHNLERIDRSLGFPATPAPSFSVKDDRWRQEHSRMMAKVIPPAVDPQLATANLRVAEAAGAAVSR